ncbi:transporter substrate-binding domain-containing protein [Paludicola sp. MB14-C6]|uniref:transporter substrate-binding domain-containing protein n=1 Tax=Paludihabitans sp. MB14-C6 TaxID=3070656 RepID=UPI0027DB1C81|nr:transporter substrate-binding domain-containing protein [Paludicola sp. MB14-C6]WMJ22000.1 transporter substrate-binding domain-containing protein [Paludicola sp. MB14-C6]
MKKIISILLITIMVAAMFVGCKGNENSLEAIKKNGKITMLTNATFAPFEFVENNKVVGVDPELAQMIADEIGVKLEITNMDFDLLVDYVKTGKGDFAAAGMTITDERKKQVDFSIEYTTSTQYIIVKKGTDVKSFSPNGKVIGVQQGTTGDLFYASDKKVIQAKEVKRYKSSIDAAKDILLGRVDCVIVDELPAKKIVEQNKDTLECFNPGYEPESYAFAVKKENKELLDVINKVLQKQVESGKVKELVLKHS